MGEINNNITIVITTHSNYIDICELFLKLFTSNWNECPFKIIISITGERKFIDGYKCIYNGENSTLPGCLVNAVNEEDTEYYIHFLGDAFFINKVDNNKVIILINQLIQLKAQYCSFLPSKSKSKKSDYYRNICSQDIYAYNYVAFFASKKFILNEFSKYSTDFDFEVKYLKLFQQIKETKVFADHYIINFNLFKIMTGVEKGKWNRKTYKYIKKNYSYYEIPYREKTTISTTVKNCIINAMSPYIKPKYRKILKYYLRKYLKIKFVSKY